MKVLVVVDFQNDFVTGALGDARAKGMDAPIAGRIREYLAAGDEVVFTLDWHDPDHYLESQEGRRLPIVHCTTHEGRAVFGETGSYVKDDNTIRKNGFGSIELWERFKDKDVEQFELCGCFITPCLMTCAVMLKGSFPEARIVVDRNLTMSPDDAIGEKALDVMENMQIDILNRGRDDRDQVTFYR